MNNEHYYIIAMYFNFKWEQDDDNDGCLRSKEYFDNSELLSVCTSFGQAKQIAIEQSERFGECYTVFVFECDRSPTALLADGLGNQTIIAIYINKIPFTMSDNKEPNYSFILTPVNTVV